MPLVSDRCLCLRKTEYSETSQILTLLSRQLGIVRVMAKGAHRRTKAGASRFDGGIDLLDIGDAVFSDDTSRELAFLTDWKLEDGIFLFATAFGRFTLLSMPGNSSGLFWRSTIRIP